MSRVGMTVDPYKGIPLPVLFRAIRLFGVKRVEVTPRFLNFVPSTLRTVRGMSLGFHLPSAGLEDYDFSSRSRRSDIDNFIVQIHDLSKRVSFQYAVCHPPEAPKEDRSLDLYFQSLRNLGLPLVLENIPTCAGQDFLQFYSRCLHTLGDQLLGVCLDISHARLSGDVWQDIFRYFGSQIRVIHLSDIRGDEDRHAPFGKSSTLTLQSILDCLLTWNYQGILNFEILPEGFRGIVQMFRNIRQAQKLFDV